MPRFSITKKQLNSEQGRSLLALLMEITSDGKITDDEVERVEQWIRSNGADLPAAGYLREVLQTIISDGRVSLADRWDLLLAIEQVVPPEERVLVKMRRRSTPEPVTPRQLEFLRILRVEHTDNMTKEEAADLIDAHKDRHSRKRRSKKAEGGGCAGCLLILVVLALVGYCNRPRPVEQPKPDTPPATKPAPTRR